MTLVFLLFFLQADNPITLQTYEELGIKSISEITLKSDMTNRMSTLDISRTSKQREVNQEHCDERKNELNKMFKKLREDLSSNKVALQYLKLAHAQLFASLDVILGYYDPKTMAGEAKRDFKTQLYLVKIEIE